MNSCLVFIFTMKRILGLKKPRGDDNDDNDRMKIQKVNFTKYLGLTSNFNNYIKLA